MEERSKSTDKVSAADLKKSFEKLDSHLDRIHCTHKETRPEEPKKVKEEWEIDGRNLLVKHVIGRGTFGAVHRGDFNGQDVAVKVLNLGDENGGQRTKASIASMKKVFMQEISVWHKLDHPNVCKLVGGMMGTSELKIETRKSGPIDMPLNICSLVAEYQPGGTLKSYLIKNSAKKLPLKTVIRLAVDLAKGLSYIHSKKIVHRDIKTENVLLGCNEEVKITDFGVARLEASCSQPEDMSSPHSKGQNMTGQTGTLGYMAPEVFENKPYNRKCDVYSFGICLWEMYCCEMPFRSLAFNEHIPAAVYRSARPKIPKRCPRSLAEVMNKCWDPDPEKRPEMEEVVRMLDAIDTSSPLHMPQGCFGIKFRIRKVSPTRV